MTTSDEELVRVIRSKENPLPGAEMTQLVYRYTRIIRRKAAKLGRSGAEPDDLIQEGFLGLIAAVRTYREKRGKFSVYANTCIENRMKSAVLKAGAGYTAEADYDFNLLSDDGTPTEESVILKEQNAELFKKLESLLSGREFEVLRLYLAGYRYKEIAARLSLSVKAVDNSLSRLRRKLKKLL
ncbi:MAG: sigma-70 family RNA polymerase sigma factor [Eubacterium sp.]|nr:sigma-70 family RNA polymerase sigma factor [Eubacterium sp.]MCM1417935.1 sigma-70 family RNA polymerase sigma factor [Roseburia sp.]